MPYKVSYRLLCESYSLTMRMRLAYYANDIRLLCESYSRTMRIMFAYYANHVRLLCGSYFELAWTLLFFASFTYLTVMQCTLSLRNVSAHHACTTGHLKKSFRLSEPSQNIKISAWFLNYCSRNQSTSTSSKTHQQPPFIAVSSSFNSVHFESLSIHSRTCRHVEVSPHVTVVIFFAHA